MGALAIHALQVQGCSLESVGIPEEVVLDVLYQHRLASLAELLLKDPATSGCKSTNLLLMGVPYNTLHVHA